jgi:hypothetical protein
MKAKEFLERARGINNKINRHLELHKEWVDIYEKVKGTPSEKVVEKYLEGYAKALDDLCFIKHSTLLVIMPVLDEDEYKVIKFCIFEDCPEEFMEDAFNGDKNYADECYSSAIEKIEKKFEEK